MTQTYSASMQIPESASFWEEAYDSIVMEESPPPESAWESGPFALEHMVTKLLKSGGREKQSCADEVLDKIRGREDSATRAAWTAYMILNSRKPGRIDDCVGLLSRLGANVVRDAMLDALMHHPPTTARPVAWLEDYWFALIRSLGFLSNQNGSDRFRSTIEVASRYSIPAIREAAVYSLAEIGDERAIERLSAMAHADPSPMIRELAQEAIRDAGSISS